MPLHPGLMLATRQIGRRRLGSKSPLKLHLTSMMPIPQTDQHFFHMPKRLSSALLPCKFSQHFPHQVQGSFKLAMASRFDDKWLDRPNFMPSKYCLLACSMPVLVGFCDFG